MVPRRARLAESLFACDEGFVVMGCGGLVRDLVRLTGEESAGPQPWARTFAG